MPASRGEVKAKNGGEVPKCQSVLIAPGRAAGTGDLLWGLRDVLLCFSARSLGAVVLYSVLNLLPARGCLMPSPPSLSDHTRAASHMNGVRTSWLRLGLPSAPGMGGQAGGSALITSA